MDGYQCYVKEPYPLQETCPENGRTVRDKLLNKFGASNFRESSGGGSTASGGFVETIHVDCEYVGAAFSASAVFDTKLGLPAIPTSLVVTYVKKKWQPESQEISFKGGLDCLSSVNPILDKISNEIAKDFIPENGHEFVANFDQTDVKGSFKINVKDNGNAHYKFKVNLNDFVSHNNCDITDGLTYHIHSYWNDNYSSSAVGPDCGAEYTGGHYDPFLACGPATSNTDECGALARTKDDNYEYLCNPESHSRGEYQKCEVGDLSGKFGKVVPISPYNLIYEFESEDVFGPVKANFDVNEYDGITKSWASAVFHCSADGGSRQFCAKFEQND